MLFVAFENLRTKNDPTNPCLWVSHLPKKSFIPFVYPKFINKIKITTFLVGMNIEFSKSYMEALTLLLQYKIRPDTILFYF